jgi:hypothetical protein
MFGPQTRSTWPLTPPAAGDDSHDTASATSIGRPACCRDDSRRATSRVASGIFAVISVSMKPGATALIVPAPCAANAAADERTSPITPALVAP